MRADGCYGECLVARKATLGGTVIKASLIGFSVLLVLLGFGLSQWILFLAAILVYVTIMIWPKFDVVYEYVFVDGQLDFDKILGGNGRKHVKRIDMDKVEIVAPMNSHALDGYKHLNLKPVDFTSLIHDDEHKVFSIMYKGEQGMECIWFEPNDALLGLMKYKSPRKIVEI